MSTLRNKVQLIGHLGNDPIIKTTSTGTNYSVLRLATNDLFKNKAGEWVEEVQWHTLVIWGKQNNTIEKKCRRGTKLMVEGKLTYRNYENAEGIKTYITEIKVDSFLILSDQTCSNEDIPVLQEEDEDELPF
ncbi:MULTISPECIES: single-stranded DNA-binding protein [Sphingobacterium]|uniref:Single-stranded DNA-binding protein n=1 Tax=Sphingobacterium ginsenosidimutans TaxID=687845 RepID=A0ABP8ANI3_9SPHI|nr:single-stranded DNA-binding protein [Sphingobacterium sp. E70]ULT27860.1 single-stranded DNA-binding protein [Sphingobacterium sp. E70]